MCDHGPLDGAVPAEGEAGLVVDVLRVSCVRAVVAVVDGNLDLRSFGMRLEEPQEQRIQKTPAEAVCCDPDQVLSLGRSVSPCS